MTTELLLTQEQTQVIAQKREAWALMGEAVYKSELQLQVQAQAALNDIVLPATIEELPEAETKLKEVKSALTIVTNNRKAITSKFDDVTARLMQPEKSFAEPIKMLSDAIIVVKKSYEAEQAKKQLRFDEIRRVRDHFTNERIRVDAELSQKVNSLVARCYENALNTNVAPNGIADYLKKSKAAVTSSQFTALARSIPTNNLTDDEVRSVVSELFTINQQAYADQFATEIDAKFSDYSIAYANKEQALKLAKEEEDKKAAALESQRRQQEVAVKIDSASQATSVEPVLTKALKQSYEVDMPETVEGFLSIMAAFSANIHLCLPKLKVTKWFSFTATQAAAALGKVKSDDNAFNPSGITFKSVDKL
jgi:hypothetical protein